MSIKIKIDRHFGEMGGFPLTEEASDWYQEHEDVVSESVQEVLSDYDTTSKEDFTNILMECTDEDEDGLNEFVKCFLDKETQETITYVESHLYVGEVSLQEIDEFEIVFIDTETDEEVTKVIDMSDQKYTDMNWYSNEANIETWLEENDEAYTKLSNLQETLGYDYDEALVEVGCPFKDEENPEYSNWVMITNSVSKGSYTGMMPEHIKTIDDIDMDKISCDTVTPFGDFGYYVSPDSIKYNGEDLNIEGDGSDGKSFEIELVIS